MGVETVIILTSPRTAGAAELLINALRGIDAVRLVVVGDVTEGMNVGMVHQRHSTDEWEYDVWMESWRAYNASGQGDYHYGLVPNTGTLSEWRGEGVIWSDTWGWKGELGRTEDPLLERALEFVVGTATMPGAGVMDGSTRERAGLPREFPVPTRMVLSTDYAPEPPEPPVDPPTDSE